jgi:hypothetical protein
MAAFACLTAKELILSTPKHTGCHGCLFGATLSATAVDADATTSKIINASDAIVRHATTADIATACYPSFTVFPSCIADILAAIPACTAIAENAAVTTRFHASSLQHTSSSPFIIVFSIVARSCDLPFVLSQQPQFSLQAMP